MSVRFFEVTHVDVFSNADVRVLVNVKSVMSVADDRDGNGGAWLWLEGGGFLHTKESYDDVVGMVLRAGEDGV